MRSILLALTFLISSLFAKEIILTFDDAPMPSTELFSAEGRVLVLLEKLKLEKVTAVFFCIGRECESESGRKCLAHIASTSNIIANHSFSHRHLSELSLEEFEYELDRSSELLSAYPNYVPIFRFPYLDLGNREKIGGSEEKKKAALDLLTERGFKISLPSINTFDWSVNGSMLKAISKKQTVDFEKLREVYLQLLMEWVDHYESGWAKVKSNDVPHVLLLHASDLNTLFVEDIIATLRAKGWDIGSADKIYDPRLSTLVPIPCSAPVSLSTDKIDERLLLEGVFR